MRVQTYNNVRTISETTDLFNWCLDHFGYPGTDSGNRWAYGKRPDWIGSTICSGPFDIEWIAFKQEKDATVFLLAWPEPNEP